MNSNGQARPGLYIGVAGWSLPKAYADRFADVGTHLERYASRFPAVEINSSFYRPHRPATYARWNAAVPRHFRFSVKVPKAVTHELRLEHTEDALDRFLAEVTELADKLGPLLIQLPPSLSFSADNANRFFESLRKRFDGDVVFEPRHASWFEPSANQMAEDYRLARVAADPAVVPSAAVPGGWKGLVYRRMHGSPETYYSNYSTDHLAELAKTMVSAAAFSDVWCIFDNTAASAATANALDLLAMAQARMQCGR